MKVLLFISCFTISIWALPVEENKALLRNVGHRIINGQTAAKGQFPWQAAVFFTTSSGRQSFCGGSIISNIWILTAAHCASGALNFTIYLGTNSLNPDSGTTVAYTKTAIVHPLWDPSSISNDIALIRLEEPITMNQYIQLIPVSSIPLNSNVSLTVSGWGKTSDASSGVSNSLNFVDLTTISNYECANYYGSLGSEVVCAVGTTGQSTCNGDSGGPLVLGTGRNALHVGIVSFVSSRGCESGFPSGYVRTHYYREWIRLQTGI